MAGVGDFEYKLFRKDWDNLLERQKYKEAEKLCHEGLAKSPLDQSRGRLYNHLGYLYENFLDDKTFDDILEHYVLSLQVDESNANSHYNLANFLLEQGMQHLLRSLELNPQHTKASKRFANLTPVKVNTTLDLGAQKYQVVEVQEDGVKAIRLRKRSDGQYERTHDDPVYVEVSSPEKVHPASTNNHGRTKNLGRGGGPAPLSIESNGGAGPGGGGCCFRCVLQWWFWALLWILAVGGVVLPVLGFFNVLEEEECSETVTADKVAINDDPASQGDLNVLFVVDCGAEDWDSQFVAADALLTGIAGDTAPVAIKYDVLQFCNTAAAGYIGNASVDDFTAYDGEIDASSMTQESAVGGDNTMFSGALSACSDTFDSYDDEDSTPFLCVPFISQEFDDPFDAMAITADSAFADIYLAFMVDEGDSDWMPSVYSVLGAFATGTECIARLESEDAFANSWWDSQFNCDSGTEQQTYCQHCINYANAAQLSCVGEVANGVFSGLGVTETVVTGSSTECVHSFEDLLFYALGGVVPLLLWTLIAILVLCCGSCRACGGNRRRNMESAMNRNQQTGFV